MEQVPVHIALRKVINAKFADSTASDRSTNPTWLRSKVRKAISCRRYKFQSVDYGNIEEVDVKDLHKNVIRGRVPIQMKRYRLTNVVPKDGNTWTTEDLDILHSLIVDKQC